MEVRTKKNSNVISRASGLFVARKSLVLLAFVFLSTISRAEAQCAMCRAVLESSGDNSMAEGINNGIVYLMAIPYLVVAFLIFFVYRKMRS